MSDLHLILSAGCAATATALQVADYYYQRKIVGDSVTELYASIQEHLDRAVDELNTNLQGRTTRQTSSPLER